MKKTLKTLANDSFAETLETHRHPKKMGQDYNASVVMAAIASQESVTGWFASLYRDHGHDIQATLDELSSAIIVQPYTAGACQWVRNSVPKLVEHTGMLGDGVTLRMYYKGRQSDSAPSVDTAECNPLWGVRDTNEHDTNTPRDYVHMALWSAPVNPKGKGKGKGKGNNQRKNGSESQPGNLDLCHVLSLIPEEERLSAIQELFSPKAALISNEDRQQLANWLIDLATKPKATRKHRKTA